MTIPSFSWRPTGCVLSNTVSFLRTRPGGSSVRFTPFNVWEMERGSKASTFGSFQMLFIRK